jgi:(E)-4-hydroxy-3-methylbut-2-enyl-diphosphate synthase
MTNTDTADVTVHGQSGDGAGARGLGTGARHRQTPKPPPQAVPKIVDTLDKFGVRVPIIGDFHYNGHLLLKKYPACARALAKYRINPGNVNIGKKHDDNFRTMIEAAIEYGAGAHRRQLGLARSGAAHAHDGREQRWPSRWTRRK